MVAASSEGTTIALRSSPGGFIEDPVLRALGLCHEHATTTAQAELLDAVLTNDAGRIGLALEGQDHEVLLPTELLSPLMVLMLHRANAGSWRALGYDGNTILTQSARPLRAFEVACNTCSPRRLSELLDMGAISFEPSLRHGLLGEDPDQFDFWAQRWEERHLLDMPPAGRWLCHASALPGASAEVGRRGEDMARRWLRNQTQYHDAAACWRRWGQAPLQAEPRSPLWLQPIFKQLLAVVNPGPLRPRLVSEADLNWTAAIVGAGGIPVGSELVNAFVNCLGSSLSHISPGQNLLWTQIKLRLKETQPDLYLRIPAILREAPQLDDILWTLGDATSETIMAGLLMDFNTHPAKGKSKLPARL